jgi:hypothetical protein
LITDPLHFVIEGCVDPREPLRLPDGRRRKPNAFLNESLTKIQ